jgi:hypothetical protein
MKLSHIFWGVLFLSLGILFLITNFTPIYFAWEFILKFWPLILILWGVSLLIKNNAGRAFMTAVVSIVLAFFIYAGVKSIFSFTGTNFIFDSDDHPMTERVFSEPFNDEIQTASFNFNAGAGSFTLKQTTDELFEAVINNDRNNYQLERLDEAYNAKINMDLKDQKIGFLKIKNSNKVDILLNQNPVWNMNINVGASSVKFDLSPFKIDRLSLHTGASSVHLRLGDHSDSMEVFIDAGASSIKIELPEHAACEIRIDDALSSKKFRGFTKINSGHYTTENFDTADKKIFLKINTGVSSVSVNRYSGW